jgi:hypothetical protein
LWKSGEAKEALRCGHRWRWRSWTCNRLCLAKNHGLTNIAVLERGWLAGAIARNTTIIRSNYLWDESADIYEHSLKLWETWRKIQYEMFLASGVC